MSKITKDIRQSICKKAISAKFDPQKAILTKEENKLAIECYNHIFPKKIRDIIAQVPEDWIRHCDCLRFNAAGWHVQLCAGKKMPTPAANHCSMLGSITGELAEKAQAFVTATKKHSEDQAIATRKMLGFLEQFTTFKRLEEAWPEGKQFYAAFNADRPSAGLPAVITAEINDMLGLKSPKKSTSKE